VTRVHDLDALLALDPMRPVWSWALAWFRSRPEPPSLRARQARLIALLKAALRPIRTPAELDASYAADSRWTTRVVRKQRPRDWSTPGLHACMASAYALRYVEIVTGRRLDPRKALPHWVDEWCT
jgi:hypothetical protein